MSNTIAKRGMVFKLQEALSGKGSKSFKTDLFSVGSAFDVYAEFMVEKEAIVSIVCAVQYLFSVESKVADFECIKEPLWEEDMLTYKGVPRAIKVDVAEFASLDDATQIGKLMPLAEETFKEAEKVANLLAEQSKLEVSLVL